MRTNTALRRTASAVLLLVMAEWLLSQRPGAPAPSQAHAAGQRPKPATPEPSGQELRRSSASSPEPLDLSPDERINIEVYEKANRSVVNITTKVRNEDFPLFAELQEEGSASGCVY